MAVQSADTARVAVLRRNQPLLRFGGRLKLRRRLGEREAFFLALICALDMYTTLWWVMTGRATEANPFLAWTFTHHPLLFVLVKCALFLPALIFATRVLAPRHPELVTNLLRLVLVGYVGIYLTGVQ